MATATRRPTSKTVAQSKRIAKPKRIAKAKAPPRPRPKVPGAPGALLTRLRAICLALPATKEVEAWGHPTFRVGDKIFATFGDGADGGAASMGVKTTHELQAALVGSDLRFKIAAYVGKHGWVQMTLAAPVDWNEVEALVRESYRLIAPARVAAAMKTSPTRR
jgi:predicted DNA-binding protein (MmcQ/YjbR family)